MADDGLEAAVDEAMAAVIAWQKRAREALWASPSRSQVRETIRAQWERAEAAEARLAAIAACCRNPGHAYVGHLMAERILAIIGSEEERP